MYEEQHPTTTRHFVGRSVDRKPRPGQLGPDGKTPVAADIPNGSTLTEIDTGLRFIWGSNRWNPERHVLSDLMLQILAESKKQTKFLESINAKGSN